MSLAAHPASSSNGRQASLDRWAERDVPSRRTFLRGLGTALAVPLLPSALPRAAWASAESTPPPVRMAFFFVPNGVHMPAWQPVEEGADFAMPASLEPIAAWRKKLLVVSGLALDAGFAHGDGAGDHARCAATFLTGAHPVKTDGKGIRAGVSVDQLAATAWSGKTRFASLELGMEAGRNAGSCDSGYSCAYSNNISWRSPQSPATKENDPRLVFERLFGAGDANQRAEARARRTWEQQSILDLVQDDARRLQRRLAQDDRYKLDEYLEGVREFELRLDADEGDEKTIDEGKRLRRPAGIPHEYDRHFRLMADLITLAFRADLTRVVTFMMGNAGSQQTYPKVGVTTGHHSLSHHGNDPEKLRQISQINKFHVSQWAYLLGRLDAISETEGTLLDHSMVVYGSGLSDGNRHNHDDLPILMAGGGAGAIETGKHVRVAPSTPLTNLYLRMLHVADVNVESIGDSTGPLPL